MGENSQAAFSSCRHYRWWLARCWDPAAPVMLFIGLNPSLATAQRDDPTLRRLQGFARRWGYGGVEVLNLFARIAASPAVLRRSTDPVGSENDRWLQERLQVLAGSAGAGLWLGWGNGGAWRGRDGQVLRQIAGTSLPVWVLGRTASGQPRHPLYVAGDAVPQRWGHP